MLRLVQRKVCRLVSLVTLVILVSSQATVQAVGDRTPESLARQGKQLGISEPEQKYDLDISFPIDADEAVNDEGRRERIDELIQAILNDKELAVNDTLPGTLLDPSSIIFDTTFKCESGQVVVDDQCVPCPPGTYFDEAKQICTKCAIGFYNPDFAQRACTKCPAVQDLEGVTKDLGSTKSSDCKQKCAAGHFYDEPTNLCRPCGFGNYQPEEGQFRCELCGVGLTTRTKRATSEAECREDCQDGFQLGLTGECEQCPVGTYRLQGRDRGCKACPADRTTNRAASKTIEDCNLPICIPGQYLNANDNECQACPVGTFQPNSQETSCIRCPYDTSTATVGSTNETQCTNPCKAKDNGEGMCDRNARCLFLKEQNDHTCECKFGYEGDGEKGGLGCKSKCDGFCRNGGSCLINKEGSPYCTCKGSFTGLNCAEKSDFAYIAGGIAGAVLFVIVLVLLIWMIFIRNSRNRQRSSEKFAPSVGDMTGSQVNFYYGQPAPYAESIAPSQHGSTYAHYYEDEEDGWGMPNFYDTYGKNSKIARSNGSLYNAGMYAPQYAPQGELYDRLGKHAYQPRPEEKSGNDTTSESEDDRSRRQ